MGQKFSVFTGTKSKNSKGIIHFDLKREKINFSHEYLKRTALSVKFKPEIMV